MNIYEFVFIVQFVIFIGIFLVKLYNVMSKGRAYDVKVSFLLFILGLFCHAVGFWIFMLKPEELIYWSLIRLENVISLVLVLFFFIELLLSWVKVVEESRIKPRMSINVR